MAGKSLAPAAATTADSRIARTGRAYTRIELVGKKPSCSPHPRSRKDTHYARGHFLQPSLTHVTSHAQRKTKLLQIRHYCTRCFCASARHQQLAWQGDSWHACSRRAHAFTPHDLRAIVAGGGRNPSSRHCSVCCFRTRMCVQSFHLHHRTLSIMRTMPPFAPPRADAEASFPASRP